MKIFSPPYRGSARPVDGVHGLYVYALADPADGLYRYIGGAYGNPNRLNAHSTSKGAKSTRAWFAGLSFVGREATRKILFTCDTKDEVRWAETAAWDCYKAKGHPLLNARPNHRPDELYSPEAKAKRRETDLRPEVRARRSAALRNAFARPEVKARQSAAQLEAQNRPEVNAMRGASLRGTNARGEVKARRSAAQLEAQNRPEVNTRRSASLRRTNARPEVKNRQSVAQLEAQNRPEVNAKRSSSQRETSARLEVKTKRSAAIREALARPEVRVKLAVRDQKARERTR